MGYSKAPQRFCLFLAIITDIIPMFFLLYDADVITEPAFFLIILICAAISIPFYLLRALFIRTQNLLEEINQLKYEKFNVEELINAAKQEAFLESASVPQQS